MAACDQLICQGVAVLACRSDAKSRASHRKLIPARFGKVRKLAHFCLHTAASDLVLASSLSCRSSSLAFPTCCLTAFSFEQAVRPLCCSVSQGYCNPSSLRGFSSQGEAVSPPLELHEEPAVKQPLARQVTVHFSLCSESSARNIKSSALDESGSEWPDSADLS